jgi:hypothetical protein
VVDPEIDTEEAEHSSDNENSPILSPEKKVYIYFS